jgi:hypothetical protein
MLELDLAARTEIFKQSNQAAIDFSLKALSYLFLLNGAAATALLAQDSFWLKITACLFAVGALFSIFALAFAYLHMKVTAHSWIINQVEEDIPGSFTESELLSYAAWGGKSLAFYEKASTIMAFISMGFFVAGIISCLMVVIKGA